MDTQDTIILGAGLAGLTAAYYLQKHNMPFRILEARDRIGGRVYTIPTHSGGTIEMGATWFAPKHIHLLNLIQELSVPYQKQYKGTKVLYDFANPHRMTQLFELPIQSEDQYIFTQGTCSLVKALLKHIDPALISINEEVRVLDFTKNKVRIKTIAGEYHTRRVINTLRQTY